MTQKNITRMPLESVLIIGGGIGGMAAAISLRRHGVAVELVEIDPQWRVYGAGITISPATIRSFASLGILEQMQRRGFCSDGIDIYDVAGNFLRQSSTPRLAGPDIPSAGGIMRPVLRELMSELTLSAGAAVHLGVTFTSLTEDKDRVRVEFSDGRSGIYDLVIGADGLRSKLRQNIFPHAPLPAFTGQGCWRAVVPRPRALIRPRIFMGIHDKAGVVPVSQDEMYLFLNAAEQADQYFTDADLPRLLAQRLQPYGGLVAEIRESLNEASRVLYRPLEKLLLSSPWYRGRVLLIGDAAHSTTPHLAHGAGLAVEDALVLADELSQARTVDDALARFMERRYERCRMVIENSVRMGQLEQHGGMHEEHAQLMHDSVDALAAPI